MSLFDSLMSAGGAVASVLLTLINLWLLFWLFVATILPSFVVVMLGRSGLISSLHFLVQGSIYTVIYIVILYISILGVGRFGPPDNRL